MIYVIFIVLLLYYYFLHNLFFIIIYYSIILYRYRYYHIIYLKSWWSCETCSAWTHHGDRVIFCDVTAHTETHNVCVLNTISIYVMHIVIMWDVLYMNDWRPCELCVGECWSFELCMGVWRPWGVCMVRHYNIQYVRISINTSVLVSYLQYSE